MDRRIFVTGASGYLGRHLVAQLSKKQKEIICLVRKTSDRSGLDIENMNLVEGDLCDHTTYETALQGVDVVIHCAALVGSDDPLFNQKTNVNGTEELLKAMKKHDVKRCIFISSTSAGFLKGSNYAESKKQGERL